jgi:glycosyltransferase involved in cell wall biosynthesis
VGGALRTGYAAATGKYILSMDCDFAVIVPELRDLFDVIADGRDGAIGSRFSYESVLVNYPFLKILGNRGFHVLARLALHRSLRDISNNLKLYRAPILKQLAVDEHGFAANVETGLKPLLQGWDIVEVPVSWVNRTSTMGTSSFRLLKVAPGYARVLWRLVRSVYAHR